MTESSRLTISLPADLVEAMDSVLARKNESRSALVRRVLEDALRDAAEREDVERYINGYRENPQTDEEFGWSDEATRQRLSELPW